MSDHGLIQDKNDTCHLAIEYEDPGASVEVLLDAGIRISKIHLSSALKLTPNPDSVKRLAAFQDEVYLHQVVVRSGDSVTHRFEDLPDAFSWFEEHSKNAGSRRRSVSMRHRSIGRVWTIPGIRSPGCSNC